MAAFTSGMFPEGGDQRIVDAVLRDVQRAGAEVGMSIMRPYAEFVPAEAFAACPVPLICINAAQRSPGSRSSRARERGELGAGVELPRQRGR